MVAPRVSRRRRGRRAAGFTIIEVLVALVVTVLGLTAVSGLLTAGMHGTSYARHATEATVLAEDKIETLMLLPSANLVSGRDRVDAGGKIVSVGGFLRTWEVVPAGGLVRIAVTVGWTEGDGSRALTFRTMRRL